MPVNTTGFARSEVAKLPSGKLAFVEAPSYGTGRIVEAAPGKVTLTESGKKNLVLVDVDFPRHKDQTEELKKANEALSKKYSIEGFPTVIVLSSEGKELKKQVGYDGQTTKDFIAELEKLKSQT